MPRPLTSTPLAARMRGHDIAIAAIVAGAAQHMDAARRGIARQHHGSDRFAGAPHQADAVEWTGGNRQPVGLAHFGRRQKFVAHGLPIRISVKHCPVFGPKQTGRSKLATDSCGHIVRDSGVAGARLPAKCAICPIIVRTQTIGNV